MQTPLRISFRGMEPSPALEAKIREHAGRFEHYSDRITSCHVVVDAPHRHHHKGQLYDVRIHMHVPGHDIVINREGPHDHAHEDAYVAARDAFAAAERRLEDIVGRRERSAQTREPLAEGKAIRS
jgi:ribosome-associated translation inhibitor RaiA